MTHINAAEVFERDEKVINTKQFVTCHGNVGMVNAKYFSRTKKSHAGLLTLLIVLSKINVSANGCKLSSPIYCYGE